jgi:uncharacterized membrane protein
MNPKMMPTPTVLSRLAATLGGAALLALLLRGCNAGTQLLVASSVLTFLAHLASTARVPGLRPAICLVLIALPVRWIAEEMGASYGRLLGSYDYTPVPGPQLDSVPVVIPLIRWQLMPALAGRAVTRGAA